MDVTCREFADFIMSYLTGELPAEAVTAFERHLSRCPSCRTYLGEYQATVEAGREAFADENALVPPDIPEDLVRAILASRRR
jgi:anti-sigma factor RsiW